MCGCRSALSFNPVAFSYIIGWSSFAFSFLDPMEEDILQVVKYCTDLIEEKDLEKLDLVIKYMKR